MKWHRVDSGERPDQGEIVLCVNVNRHDFALGIYSPEWRCEEADIEEYDYIESGEDYPEMSKFQVWADEDDLLNEVRQFLENTNKEAK